MKLLSFLNKAIGKIGRIWYTNNYINWIASIWFNFRQLPFKQAIHFPVLIYWGTNIIDLSGKIKLKCSSSFGLVRIGKKWTRSTTKTNFQNRGTWIINGAVVVCKGSLLMIMPEAIFETGTNVNIREYCFISVNKRIVLGNNCEMAYSCQIMDSDFHYTINTETRECRYFKADIIIGDNNWIGSYCTIKKGVKTPNKCIVASSFSLLCKDYTTFVPENAVIGGVPAKLISTNTRRIFNMDSHIQLANHYRDTNDIFTLPDDVNLDTFSD